VEEVLSECLKQVAALEVLDIAASDPGKLQRNIANYQIGKKKRGSKDPLFLSSKFSHFLCKLPGFPRSSQRLTKLISIFMLRLRNEGIRKEGVYDEKGDAIGHGDMGRVSPICFRLALIR
jgi:hypothetical protein